MRASQYLRSSLRSLAKQRNFSVTTNVRTYVSSCHSIGSIHLSRNTKIIHSSTHFQINQFSTNNNENSNDKKEEPPIEEDQIPNGSENASDDLITKLQQEVKELKDRVIRSYAEEENVRRIAKRDVENAKTYANSSFAKALLEVADDLEMALSSVPKDQLENNVFKSVYEGVEATERQLQKVFNQFKIYRYGEVGDKFDPDLHDALFQGPDATKTPGTILQVLKKGYKLHDRVIRAAQVGTVNNP